MKTPSYIGQPYSGYALKGKSKEDIIIIGVLIKKDAFFRRYLPIVYADSALFRFFIEPQTNKFSEEYLHFSTQKDDILRTLLELMVIEYADKQNDTQSLIQSRLRTFLLKAARIYRLSKNENKQKSIADQIIEYMDNHSNIVTLKDIAAHFNYHPNYISALLHKETGRKFTQILLEKRMERAVLLMKNTTLSIDEISSLLGYGNHSNFYKAFKKVSS